MRQVIIYKKYTFRIITETIIKINTIKKGKKKQKKVSKTIMIIIK